MMAFTKINNLLSNINYLMKHNLWQQREDDIVYFTNKILDDGIYEYSLGLDDTVKLKILNKLESIKYIRDTETSFVRFGDGEINLMKGQDQPFQRFDANLVSILKNILQSDNEGLSVAINHNYYIPLYSEPNNEYTRRHAYDFRCFFRKYCSPAKIYLDGACTFWRFGEHSEESEDFWHQWKELFRDKTLTIICGEGILDNLQYDVFEYCKDKKYIYGPRKHAWSQHESLKEEIIQKAGKERILVFILGMAGKGMIPEMVKLGYTAWDIGHLAKSYDAYMKNVPYSKEAISAFFAPD